MDPKYSTSGTTPGGKPHDGGGSGGGGMPLTDQFGQPAEEAFGNPAGFVSEQAQLLGERISDVVRERPVTCLLVALGTGYLIGRMLRA